MIKLKLRRIDFTISMHLLCVRCNHVLLHLLTVCFFEDYWWLISIHFNGYNRKRNLINRMFRFHLLDSMWFISLLPTISEKSNLRSSQKVKKKMNIQKILCKIDIFCSYYVVTSVNFKFKKKECLSWNGITLYM